MEEGLPQEVASLVACGYKEEDPGMQAIGYREFLSNQEFMLAAQKMKSPIAFDSFQEQCSSVDFHSIQEMICRNSRRYAKRQYTFFNNQFKNKEINWFKTNYEDFSKTVEEVSNYLLKIN